MSLIIFTQTAKADILKGSNIKSDNKIYNLSTIRVVKT